MNAHAYTHTHTHTHARTHTHMHTHTRTHTHTHLCMHACVCVWRVASETTSVGSERSSPRLLSCAKTPGGAMVARLRSTPSARPSAPTLREPASALRKVVAIASLTGSTEGRSTCSAKRGGTGDFWAGQSAAAAPLRHLSERRLRWRWQEGRSPLGQRAASGRAAGAAGSARWRPRDLSHGRACLWRPLTRLDRPRRSVRPRSGSAARACRSPRR